MINDHLSELSAIVQTRVKDAKALNHRPFRVLAAWSMAGAVLLLDTLFVATRPRKRTVKKKEVFVAL